MMKWFFGDKMRMSKPVETNVSKNTDNGEPEDAPGPSLELLSIQVDEEKKKRRRHFHFGIAHH